MNTIFVSVRAFGVIGGGAALGFAAGLGGLGAFLPAVGLGALGNTHTLSFC